MPDVVEQGIGSYYCHVRTEERVMKPKPGDKVRCNVTVSVQHRVNSFWRGYITEVSKIMEMSSMTIYFESFLEKNQDFLTTVLSDPLCSHYFTPESIERISILVVSLFQRLLEFRSDPDPEYANSLRQEFPLNLEIVVAVLEEDEEIEHEVIEESVQQDVALIPASNEAIHSLETFADSLSLKTEKCNICMEKFCAQESGENVKFSLSSMPCDHVFHHQCIVKWLQTSHTCPLCRYPMPTVKDKFH